MQLCSFKTFLRSIVLRVYRRIWPLHARPGPESLRRWSAVFIWGTSGKMSLD